MLIISGLLSCNLQNNSNVNNEEAKEATALFEQEWKELRCGLYLNATGELGFSTESEIAFVPQNELDPERCPNVFITTFGDYDDSTQLKELIDTATFEALGADFYKDKNRIYSHYAMCDGGYFRIFSEDTTSFKVLGNSYAKFKSKIYHFRNGELNADPESFRACEEIGPIAKDKNGYFSFYERISEEQLKKDLGEEQFKRLKAL